MKQNFFFFVAVLGFATQLRAESGYELWLRYKRLPDCAMTREYRSMIRSVCVDGGSPVLGSVAKELRRGLQGLLGAVQDESIDKASVIAELYRGTDAHPIVPNEKMIVFGPEGYAIVRRGRQIVITGQTDRAVLYGVFRFLRILQSLGDISHVQELSAPKMKLRMLDHWDNLRGVPERGYAGNTIWKWSQLPDTIDPRYNDYARANASIGINGAVVNNVNANVAFLTSEYLVKEAALANVFRRWGVKLYLSVNFAAPVTLGKLKTADPLDPEVREWWRKKADEIYTVIPDFGGFLVKANSEGQPGPQNYNRTHADGANMIAAALAPHQGVVIWRAFVYSSSPGSDRFTQAYDEFRPLDGQFASNVLVQVKNGPIDFQPREPFHPLFGAMPKTPLMMEFQLTQEYLGFSLHLVYEGTLMKEALDADTYEKGPGSTVARVVDGSLDHHTLSGMAGVSNIGSDSSWTGHPFAQANWYALGRLAWDPSLPARTIATEWTQQTFGTDKKLVNDILAIMVPSRENLVHYMTPLGLHHIMGVGVHYGPQPWYDKAARADWNPVYFARADSIGLGFDRTASGSNALADYDPRWQKRWGDLKTCPDSLVLWFHHVPWNYKLHSGRTLWNELCIDYYAGAEGVRKMQAQWQALKNLIDPELFVDVSKRIEIQLDEATWWRNACVLYFQSFSKQPLPAGLEQPGHDLDYYKRLRRQPVFIHH